LLAELQLQLAADRTGLDLSSIRAYVERWMEREPLPLLARAVQPCLVGFLELCKTRGLRLAVLSDYPAEAKLNALGLSHLFDVVVTAQTAEVGTFKPDPRGMRVVLDRLGVRPSETLAVGDRPDVDARTAAALGIDCYILCASCDRTTTSGWIPFPGYDALAGLVMSRLRVANAVPLDHAGERQFNQDSTSSERSLLGEAGKI
jgi:HAD superfamily hydrolase (TIGR01509 family)